MKELHLDQAFSQFKGFQLFCIDQDESLKEVDSVLFKICRI